MFKIETLGDDGWTTVDEQTFYWEALVSAKSYAHDAHRVRIVDPGGGSLLAEISEALLIGN